ncbi:MAG: cytochrome c biogenesis CcdA family protein [Nitrospiraceae bacterium]|nr:cytochrome c biogenesis CcdA family protein [Nitrospiraceae bacterium]
MDLGIAGISLAVGAGLASVLSPCVLPVVPVIVAGAEKKDRLRPLLIVTGLAMTFMIMGALSALFGSFLAGRTRLIEQAGGAVILLMGFMVFFDVSPFKRLYRLSNLRVRGEGRIGGLVLGMALGVVWVPCVGPLLSSILAMVGTGGQVGKGVLLLAFYSLGFAVPMLAVAYSSHLLQRRLTAISRHGALMRYLSGGVLVAFGVYTVLIGNFAF